MRFHFGVSLRPNISWLKWIAVAIVGLLAFFGIGTHVVLAATSGTVSMNPTTVKVEDTYTGGVYILPKTYRSGSNAGVLGDNYYSVMNYQDQGQGGVDASPILKGDVYYTYSAKNLCSSGQKVTFNYKYFVHSLPSSVFPNNNWVTPSGCQLNSRTYNSSSKYYTISMTCNNNIPFTLQFGFFNDLNGTEYFASSAISEKWDYTCDYTLQDSTSDIINNNNSNTNTIINNQNQNTQDIIDSLTDDNISSDTIDTGNDFFDNFTTSSTTGFSGIINAPIRIFQSMVNNNACTPLVLPISLNDGNVSGSSNVSLPCGNILWDNAPNAVVLMWHTIIFGVLGYRLLIDLVKFVNRLLNPNSTNEYVLDL